ncbi:MAG: hypothetical protein A2W26_07260 [Acidobacteria bacterium RBG_16_64_8]|nr:MAG: hypothetical protein A2W26_07260 [Acidobacteria bacterium RBG_16_64_8]
MLLEHEALLREELEGHHLPLGVVNREKRLDPLSGARRVEEDPVQIGVGVKLPLRPFGGKIPRDGEGDQRRYPTLEEFSHPAGHGTGIPHFDLL